MVWYDPEDLPQGLEIVTRDQWGAVPPEEKEQSEPLEPMFPPAVKIVYNCTGSRMCWNRKGCIELLKYVQWNYMDLGYPDILHNFMIGCDGAIYEGRGWLKRPEFSYGKKRNKTLDIAFIGFFMYIDPLPEQIEAAERLIEYGIQSKMIDPKYKIVWYRDESS